MKRVFEHYPILLGLNISVNTKQTTRASAQRCYKIQFALFEQETESVRKLLWTSETEKSRSMKLSSSVIVSRKELLSSLEQGFKKKSSQHLFNS